MKLDLFNFFLAQFALRRFYLITDRLPFDSKKAATRFDEVPARLNQLR